LNCYSGLEKLLVFLVQIVGSLDHMAEAQNSVVRRLVERRYKTFRASLDAFFEKLSSYGAKFDRSYGHGRQESCWRGPLRDGFDRGPHPFYCPEGWRRFGLCPIENYPPQGS
jgi:hypothetical protein